MNGAMVRVWHEKAQEQSGIKRERYPIPKEFNYRGLKNVVIKLFTVIQIILLGSYVNNKISTLMLYVHNKLVKNSNIEEWESSWSGQYIGRLDSFSVFTKNYVYLLKRQVQLPINEVTIY